MNILGINGWYTRSHDASACIIKDGELVAFIEEERLTRYKHAFEQLPYLSIDYCLKESGLNLDDIDMLAIGWDYHSKYNKRNIPIPSVAKDLIKLYLPKELFSYKRAPEIKIINHHRAHASMAYYGSEFNDAAILVLDGQGENSSISIWHGFNNKLELLREFSLNNSLGYFFESINKLLGFDYLDSGKTMGLAAYGEKTYDFKNFELLENDFTVNLPNEIRPTSESTDEQLQIIENWNSILYSKFNIHPDKIVPATNGKNFSQLEKDIAYSAQTSLEKALVHLAKIAKYLSGSKHLCLAGGTALNCNANTKLVLAKIFNKVSILPTVNDAGVSIGAALDIMTQKTDHKQSLKYTPYLGPAYDDTEILIAINKYKVFYKHILDPAIEAAKLLSQGNIIGWFQGRTEAGPRALGNRSILANPGITGMNDRVNKIKGRELWRPLAPSVLNEYQQDYFEENIDSPYMLYALTLKKTCRKLLPAITHVDDTARPQTVHRKNNPLYWELIENFRKITDIGMILNTSFNGPGEPVVCTPEDAIKMFKRSKLDFLVIGKYLVYKNTNGTTSFKI